MMNIVRALALSTATLASIPVSAVEQEKDRCVLEGGSTEKVPTAINCQRCVGWSRRNRASKIQKAGLEGVSIALASPHYEALPPH